jgi:dipeptidyl aminopeptidase/acylaminoacyl peptidase
VYAYGTSAGGTLAALLAGDGMVEAAVAKAPVSDLVGWEWPLTAYGSDYYEQIGATTPDRFRLSPLRRHALHPLLIVHGRRDRIVPLAMSRQYAAKFKRVHLWVVQGGHHTERARPELLSRAFQWLARAAGAHDY